MRTQPGAIALTVTPVSAVSRAATLVRPTTPCFEATYAALLTEATRPWAEAMLMIRPQSRASIPGRTSFVQWNTAERFSGEHVVPAVGGELDDRRDVLDARVVDQDIHAAEGLRRERDQAADLRRGRVRSASQYWTSTWFCSASRRADAPRSRAGSPKPFSTTSAPAAASLPAIPRPMPLVEPVTMADLPDSRTCGGSCARLR